MKHTKTVMVAIFGLTVLFAALMAAHGKGKPDASKDVSSKTTETAVVTNDNGSVARSFTECNITTNGNMVTEHRRETRTTMDTEGNVLETSTSEYAQSYTVGQDVPSLMRTKPATAEASAEPADSFLGLKFGEVYACTNFLNDADEPTLVYARFTPKKPLAGFDDYFVYVTPKTHQIVKVYACAKEVVDSGLRGRRHYLIEALERRYRTWARLCSYRRPCYMFDVGGGRYVTACLAGASRNYETIVAGWDNNLLTVAADETEELREEARKSAAEQRSRRVSDAADAF
ncbi:MAG: hypothetical protein ACI4R9_07590 [Kiritimatiellia bacterium]